MYNVFIKNNSICSLSESYSLITEYNIINEEAESKGVKKYLEAVKQWFTKLWESIKNKIKNMTSISKLDDIDVTKLSSSGGAYKNIEVDILDYDKLQRYFRECLVAFAKITVLTFTDDDVKDSIQNIESLTASLDENITKEKIVQHLSIKKGDNVSGDTLKKIKDNKDRTEANKMILEVATECEKYTNGHIKIMEKKIEGNSDAQSVANLKKLINTIQKFNTKYASKITMVTKF